MPRHPAEYGNLLRKLIGEHQADCWLVNTGWTGGAYGVGRRMPIQATRRLLAAVLNGTLRHADFYRDRNFGFDVPTDLPGIEPHLLHPRKTWADKMAYDAQAARLAGMFQDNFVKFVPHVDDEIRESAPQIAVA
jgi:phosphoenolpyruvate carboxykinase (ATP)